MIDTHIMVYWFGKSMNDKQSYKKYIMCKNDSSHYKHVFHKRVIKATKFTFDKCVLNVTPVAKCNPIYQIG